MVEVLVYLSATMLIPLIPALLIYMLLPNRTSVSGPFKGLSIQFKGAFGGFFVLVLIANGMIAYLRSSQSQPIEYNYYLNFQNLNDAPNDFGESIVSPKVKKQGKDPWIAHTSFNLGTTSPGAVLVTVKDIKPKDMLKFRVKRKSDGKEWESNSLSVLAHSLEMREPLGVFPSEELTPK